MKPVKRCALYTRKSTEEGLDQAFNSLDAQREACAAFVKSQKSEGWRALDTHYDDVVGEVRGFLLSRAEAALAAGVAPGHLALDPGIGFGKSVAGNLTLIRRLADLAALGYPVVLGASRKSFIWKPAGLSPRESLEGSLAAAVLGVVHGARILRVHDVAATVRAVRLAEAVESASSAA